MCLILSSHLSLFSVGVLKQLQCSENYLPPFWFIYLFIFWLFVFLSHDVSDHHILILDNDKPSKNKDAVLNDDFI